MSVSALFVWTVMVWENEALTWLMMPGIVVAFGLGANGHDIWFYVIAVVVNVVLLSGLVYGVLAFVARCRRRNSA